MTEREVREESGAGGPVPSVAIRRREGYASSYTPGPGSSAPRGTPLPVHVSGG